MVTKLIIAALMLIAAMSSSAYACGPPGAGDQFKFGDGPVMEIVKPAAMGCFFEKEKACARPVGSNQPCRWVRVPGLNDKAGKWINWP